EQAPRDLLHERAPLLLQLLQLAPEDGPVVVPVLGTEALVEELGELARLDQLPHVLAHAADHFTLDPALVDGQAGLRARRRLRNSIAAPIAAGRAGIFRAGPRAAAAHDGPVARRARDEAGEHERLAAPGPP